MRYFFGWIAFALVAGNTVAQPVDVNKAMNRAAAQATVMLSAIKANTDTSLVSPRTLENGKLKMVNSKDWTSGFFPGILWYLYQFTGDKKWKVQAAKFTANLSREQYNTTTHDLGFMVYCSYGNGFRLTKDPAYKKVIIQAAKSLSTRFSPITGAIRSWDHNKDTWKNPVIIDNMMNLELLFEATKLTGDSSFYKIAVTHANTTLKNHFRPDYSSYHVVDYDPGTGAVLKKMTHQGYADESAWARGQAWGLYGFTLCYRETKNPKYLEQAKHIASFMLNYPGFPKDQVPYWDYNAPEIPNEPRDVSAAAITASALLELDGYVKSSGYKARATQILASLGRSYVSPPKENAGFILLHSTGHKPAKSEIDVPLIYADYYYLEALLRSQKK